MKLFISRISPVIDAAASHTITVGVKDRTTIVVDEMPERTLLDLNAEIVSKVTDSDSDANPFLNQGNQLYFVTSEEPDAGSALELVREVQVPLDLLGVGIGALGGFAVSKFIG